MHVFIFYIIQRWCLSLMRGQIDEICAICSNMVQKKTWICEGWMLSREFRIFSGDFRDCYSSCWRLGKGKRLGSGPSMLPQIIKAFVCLGIMPSLSRTGFFTATQRYDELKGWKARGKLCLYANDRMCFYFSDLCFWELC